MKWVLLGAPGSGKGTQATMLAKHFDCPHISTGDMLRAAVAEGSTIGNLVKNTMEAGQLISDDMMLDVLRARLQKPDCQSGFILDGYPRNLSQAQSLENLLSELNDAIDVVIQLVVDRDTLIKRLAGRLVCSSCGAVFNRYTKPPKREPICDECGNSALLQRKDDNEETVIKRLAIYQQETEPVIDFYQQKESLLVMNADKTPTDVFKNIVQGLNKSL